ncbi:hypothetical protein [Fodinisporobacter ferrooxydans]
MHMQDIAFYIDPFALNYLQSLSIDYDVEQDEFMISRPNGLSGC